MRATRVASFCFLAAGTITGTRICALCRDYVPVSMLIQRSSDVVATSEVIRLMIGTEGKRNAFHPSRSIFYCIILVIIDTYRAGNIYIYCASNIHAVWYGILPYW